MGDILRIIGFGILLALATAWTVAAAIVFGM